MESLRSLCVKVIPKGGNSMSHLTWVLNSEPTFPFEKMETQTDLCPKSHITLRDLLVNFESIYSHQIFNIFFIQIKGMICSVSISSLWAVARPYGGWVALVSRSSSPEEVKKADRGNSEKLWVWNYYELGKEFHPWILTNALSFWFPIINHFTPSTFLVR